MNSRGFTLLELMITILVMTGIMTALYYVNLAMTRAALQHESMAQVRDEGRLALMQLSRVLRMAKESTIVTFDGEGADAALGTTAVRNIAFQAVNDADDNGVALDQDFDVELSDRMVIDVDEEDANGDGFSTTQLARFDDEGNVVQVLTNNLASASGVSFQRTTGGILISLDMHRTSNGNRPAVRTQMDQVVSVRN